MMRPIRLSMRPLTFKRTLFPVSPYSDTRTWRMTPSLLRARQQYVWKNAVAFVLLSSLSLGIYLYTFNFLAKDEFDDIEVPPISEEDLIKLRAEYQEDLKKENK